uniref:Uncharacterized protein n=1 Tax=Nothobranchius furzeri TaxID=105023 RepID=A0A8C6NKB6_NOTFU
MKLTAAFLVLSMVVLMAQPSEGFLGLLFNEVDQDLQQEVDQDLQQLDQDQQQELDQLDLDLQQLDQDQQQELDQLEQKKLNQKLVKLLHK